MRTVSACGHLIFRGDVQHFSASSDVGANESSGDLWGGERSLTSNV